MQVSWNNLISSLESHLLSWTFHSLNILGQLILLKSMLQVIPLYLFSTLASPKQVIKMVKILQQNFLW